FLLVLEELAVPVVTVLHQATFRPALYHVLRVAAEGVPRVVAPRHVVEPVDGAKLCIALGWPRDLDRDRGGGERRTVVLENGVDRPGAPLGGEVEPLQEIVPANLYLEVGSLSFERQGLGALPRFHRGL